MNNPHKQKVISEIHNWTYFLKRHLLALVNLYQPISSMPDRCMYISLSKHMGWCLHPRSIFFKTLKRPESSFNRGIDGGYPLTPIQLIPISYMPIYLCLHEYSSLDFNYNRTVNKYLALIRPLEGKFQHLDSWDNL